VRLSLRASAAAAVVSLFAITRKKKAIGILVPRHEHQWLTSDTKFLSHCVYFTFLHISRLFYVVQIQYLSVHFQIFIVLLCNTAFNFRAENNIALFFPQENTVNNDT